MTVTGMIAI